MRKDLLVIFTAAVIICCSCKHKTENIFSTPAMTYMTDGSVESTVSSKVFEYRGATMTTMDLKITENDRVIFDSYKKDEPKSKCLLYSELDGDTINISVVAEPFYGPGYTIKLFKDTCIVRYSESDKNAAVMYKQTKTDALSGGISLVPKTCTVSLTRKPAFVHGEVLEGIITLGSPEYYVVVNDKEIRYQTSLTGYFRTGPLENKDEKGGPVFK